MSPIGRAIDGKGVQLNEVMAAFRFLWAAQPHRRISPTSGFRSCTGGRHHRHPRPYPRCLSTGVAASIVAMAELAGLVEFRPVGTVPPLLHEAFRKLRGGQGRQGPEEPAPAPPDDSAELKLRSDGDRRLALQILNSQALKTMPVNSGSKKNRVTGRLMSPAISGG
ncbi:hypothetical protein [Rhizobium mesoamericanum]|uniref:hypothetical protein n=1 Tax=Rhizobium mesoamericanum TaxID=1079800 RepID=UPI00059538CF|nr:hypothetical protein [Rhizobium mesoamericanum]